MEKKKEEKRLDASSCESLALKELEADASAMDVEIVDLEGSQVDEEKNYLRAVVAFYQAHPAVMRNEEWQWRLVRVLTPGLYCLVQRLRAKYTLDYIPKSWRDPYELLKCIKKHFHLIPELVGNQYGNAAELLIQYCAWLLALRCNRAHNVVSVLAYGPHKDSHGLAYHDARWMTLTEWVIQHGVRMAELMHQVGWMKKRQLDHVRHFVHSPYQKHASALRAFVASQMGMTEKALLEFRLKRYAFVQPALKRRFDRESARIAREKEARRKNEDHHARHGHSRHPRSPNLSTEKDETPSLPPHRHRKSHREKEKSSRRHHKERLSSRDGNRKSGTSNRDHRSPTSATGSNRKRDEKKDTDTFAGISGEGNERRSNPSLANVRSGGHERKSDRARHHRHKRTQREERNLDSSHRSRERSREVRRSHGCDEHKGHNRPPRRSGRKERQRDDQSDSENGISPPISRDHHHHHHHASEEKRERQEKPKKVRVDPLQGPPAMASYHESTSSSPKSLTTCIPAKDLKDEKEDIGRVVEKKGSESGSASLSDEPEIEGLVEKESPSASARSKADQRDGKLRKGGDRSYKSKDREKTDGSQSRERSLSRRKRKVSLNKRSKKDEERRSKRRDRPEKDRALPADRKSREHKNGFHSSSHRDKSRRKEKSRNSNAK